MRRFSGFLVLTVALSAAALASLDGQTGSSTYRQTNGTRGAKPYTTWTAYGGGAHSSQYSALDQINKNTVSQLQVAWTHPVTGTVIFNPIVVDEVMYLQGSGNSIVALDAATGKEIWRHANQGSIGQRGFN
jgi:quinoprotein glucose dehydrogenase